MVATSLQIRNEVPAQNRRLSNVALKYFRDTDEFDLGCPRTLLGWDLYDHDTIDILTLEKAKARSID